jgi:predicted RND superfamily exporter protein
MNYLDWLIKQFDVLADALVEDVDGEIDRTSYFFNITKGMYLNSVIEEEMSKFEGTAFDYRLNHVYEDDRLNFLFYRMYYKLLFNCEQDDGKALHD